MAGTEPRRHPESRARSALVRGAAVSAGARGVMRVRRGSGRSSGSEAGDWIIVQDDTQPASPGHAFGWLDPNGTFVPPP